MQQACKLGRNVRGSETSAGHMSLREDTHYVWVVSSTHNIHGQLADSSTLGIRMWGALELQPKIVP